MTPFDYLGQLLDRAYAKNKALGFLLALLIVVVATAAAALLNQDGKSDARAIPTSTREAAPSTPRESQSGAAAPRARAPFDA
ncbi:hypothetical protein [Burkholderia glumae]|uniref:Uncharacterized protein n=1 Tax=Burkholderia glumae TaxID=337 RepID=A0ABY5BDY3_BURGL|nr:hypothetical protein [Burkholderia glumae]PJO24875.1 hypothetical protein Y5A_000230 [Burkholderia glumae AU6208]QHE11892.1 hypothetical protein GQR88_16865 [Burkholderia glumae AU6208]USS44651.1 hypothetical protein NFI99_23780 [Burkholderia glumae]